MDINRIRNQMTDKLKANNKAKAIEKLKRLATKWDKYYQSPKWKKLRTIKMSNNPLCEVCLKDNRYVPATECHHLRIIGSGKDNTEKMQILLDYSNLCACCHKHHQLFHEYMRTNETTQCTIDEVYDYEKKMEFVNKSYDSKDI